MPERLLAALEAGRLPRYDTVIVDEGQDFHRDWFDLLEGLLRDLSAGVVRRLPRPGPGHLRHRLQPSPVPRHRPRRELPQHPQHRRFPARARRARRRTRSRATPRASRRSSTRSRTARRPPPAPSTGSSTNWSTRSRSPPGRITIIAPHTRENSCLSGVDQPRRPAALDRPAEPRGRRALHDDPQVQGPRIRRRHPRRRARGRPLPRPRLPLHRGVRGRGCCCTCSR